MATDKQDAVHLEMTAMATEDRPNDDNLKTHGIVLESAFAHMGFFQLGRLFWWTSLLAVLALSGALFDGYAITIPGSIAADSSFVEAFGTVTSTDGTKSLNAQYVSAWGGMSGGVQIVSMVAGSFLSDRYGRKFNFFGICLFMAIAIVLELTAKNWIYFLMARAMAGWAGGLVKATLPCYVAEISPNGLRSALLTMYSFWYAMGQFGAAVALEIVEQQKLGWRNAFYSELTFLGIFLPVAIFLPESPWFYANKKSHEDAKNMLRKLNSRVPGYDVEREYAVIAAEVMHNEYLQQQQASTTWMEAFRGINGRRTWISFLPLATQQLVGSALVFTYMSYLFSLANVNNPFIISVASDVILLVMIVFTTFTIDKMGRRPLLLVTVTITMLCNVIFGVFGTMANHNGGDFTTTQSNTVIAITCIWVAAYSMGPACLGYIYVADTSTPLLRAKTTAFASAMSGAFALIFTYCTPLMISDQDAGWGLQVGYFYAPLSLITLVLIYFTVPETGGRSFRELDELFEARISTRKFGRTNLDELEN